MARPKIKNLESFREIMRTGSVTEAAKILGLTQSAVSRQLAQLEKEFGLELFHRDKGRLIPLSDAVELCQEVDLALSSFDRLELLAGDLRNLMRGQLRVVGPPSFVEGMLPEVVASFLELHPDIQFTLDSRNYETIVEQAACRAVDCGFLKLPVSHPNLDIIPLITGGTVCVVPEGHKFENYKFLSPKELDNYPLVLLGKGLTFHRVIQQAFLRENARMNVKVSTHTIGASCALAGQGVGVAIVNELIAKSYRGMKIKLIPFKPYIEHQYAFVSSSQIPMSRITRAFLDHCSVFFKSQDIE